MADQNSKCAGPFGPSDIPTGVEAFAAGATTFTEPCRGFDVLTSGDFEVVMIDGSTATYTFTAPHRWSGYIKGMGAATTGTGAGLK